jgi:disulfide bond formation protein DsbB
MDLPTDTRGRATMVAWLVAVVATAGSLTYSLGMGLYPCELCWYQRILMYPLVVIFGYATLTEQADVHRLALPLAVPGLAIATYHSWLQLSADPSCSFGGSCGVVQYRLAGVLAIPNQSAIAFLLVTLAMLGCWRAFREE